MTTNITEDHRRAFEALTSGEARNFCLFCCFLSGQPTAAITACPPREEGGKPEYVISPLFISITDDMVLTDHYSAPGSLDTSLSHAAGLIEIAACHA